MLVVEASGSPAMRSTEDGCISHVAAVWGATRRGCPGQAHGFRL